jgi:CBS domain containing-hemolysin-like protein
MSNPLSSPCQPLDTLFQRFIADRDQIMLVTDEFGTAVGLVSFEDVIETIFGFEIVDETDKVADLQQHARSCGTNEHAEWASM